MKGNDKKVTLKQALDRAAVLRTDLQAMDAQNAGLRLTIEKQKGELEDLRLWKRRRQDEAAMLGDLISVGISVLRGQTSHIHSIPGIHKRLADTLK